MGAGSWVVRHACRASQAMKYKLWWIALVVLASVCAADVVCFAFTGWTPFAIGDGGSLVALRLLIGLIVGFVAFVRADYGDHLSDRSK